MADPTLTDTAALVARLRELAEKATPAPWEADSEKDENRVHYAVMLSPEGHSMFDSMNTDYRVGLIETESDGEYVDQWDETARRNFALIAELRNALPQILSALESLSAPPPAGEVEAVARAIYASLTLGPWENLLDAMQEEWRNRARAAIAALPRRDGMREAAEALCVRFDHPLNGDQLVKHFMKWPEYAAFRAALGES